MKEFTSVSKEKLKNVQHTKSKSPSIGSIVKNPLVLAMVNSISPKMKAGIFSALLVMVIGAGTVIYWAYLLFITLLG